MKNRFEVSSEGMRMLHESRPLWQLVKELIANSWDEDITYCYVDIENIQRGKIKITVQDDGPGFSDITDAYTLMSPTSKRSDSLVRGRFNIGEKELISVAHDAVIETVGNTVEFPSKGGRKIMENNREKGTSITVVLKHGISDPVELDKHIISNCDTLALFIPPKKVDYKVRYQTHPDDVACVVDSIHSSRKFVATAKAPLTTVLAAEPNKPIRTTSRNTTIDVYECGTVVGNSGWIPETGKIYEMGILIQEIPIPFQVDINQKVPLPPNRDVVSNSYLQDIYAEVLNVTQEYLTEKNVSESWVKVGMEDTRCTIATVVKIFDVGFGKVTILWSSDTQANERAIEDGKDIVHPKTFSDIEKDRFKEIGLTLTTNGYGFSADEIDSMKIKQVDITPDHKNVEAYAKWLCKELLGFELTVTFFHNPEHYASASYGNRTMNFNCAKLNKRWFKFDNANAPMGADMHGKGIPFQHQTDLLLHELAHENEGKKPHTGDYVHRLSELGAKAVHLALQSHRRDWFVVWNK